MAVPFQDCIIALSGKFDETHGKQAFLGLHSAQEPATTIRHLIFLCIAKATIGALIKKNGGKHSTKVSGGGEGWWVTHLITTAKHIEAHAEKGETYSCSTIKIRMA